MKRWVLLTLLLYVLCLSVVVVPFFFAFSGVNKGLLQFFYIWFVPILILVQGVLLLVPLAVVHERPVKRRHSVLSAVIGAIPMAVLALGFFGCIALIIWSEEAVDNYLYNWPALIIFTFFWLFWGILFYRNSIGNNPNAFTSYLTRWFLRGSILELLVAIPSHIISRQREDCCAPPLTLLGIATGLAIALLSFGPGVFFLFAERIKAKNGKRNV